MDEVRRAGCTWGHRAVRIRPHDGGLDVTTRTAPRHFAEQVESGTTVQLSLDLLDALHSTFGAPGAPVHGQPGAHGFEVGDQSAGEAGDPGQLRVAGGAGPVRQVSTRAPGEYLREVADEVVSLLQLWAGVEHRLELVGGDLEQVLQGAVARGDDCPVDLGAGEVLIGDGGGGVEPGLRDGRRVGVLVEFVVAEQPQHPVVFVRGGRDGGGRVQEPVGAFDVLGDPGQFGRAQHVQGVGDGAVRSVRVGGDGGQDLDRSVLRVACQEPGRPGGRGRCWRCGGSGSGSARGRQRPADPGRQAERRSLRGGRGRR